ncbi:MAG: inositol monophosphatase [Cyclobacteriaceae bacterium]|nr:inositol monophosphatase [Cyclobacteriaceae bacterium]
MIEKIVRQAGAVAAQAAQFIRKERVSFDQNVVERKGRNDLVSYVDKQSEQLLVAGLKNILPQAGFITEEATIKHERKEWTWIIDPLDGTTNFVHGHPPYSVSIGLLHQDEIVGGIVYEVNRDELFMAWKGGGAYLNDEPIRVTNTHSLSDSLIATGFPVQDFSYIDTYLKIVKDLMQDSHGLRRLGSAATDLAYVACGRYDAYFESNLNAWDVAAGILLVQEAGGNVSDYSGGIDYLFGRQLIAGGPVHAEVLRIVKKHWA